MDMMGGIDFVPEEMKGASRKEWGFTQEVKRLIAQGRVAVKVAVTGLAGLPVLVNLARETGLMDDLVRSDSAWYQRDVLDHCEEHGYGFAITEGKDEAVLQTLA